MCGISGVELLVIIVAAIIILGPDKLPDLMRMAGKLARDLRRLRGELGDVTRELRSQVNVDELQKQFTKDIEIDRARERMKDAESEIDAIRARLNRPVDIPPRKPDALPELRRADGAIAQGDGLEADTLAADGGTEPTALASDAASGDGSGAPKRVLSTASGGPPPPIPPPLPIGSIEASDPSSAEPAGPPTVQPSEPNSASDPE